MARRMRERGFKGKTVSVSVRDTGLVSFTRQKKLDDYTNITSEIAESAMELFRNSYGWSRPIRSLGISMSDFVGEDYSCQMNIFEDQSRKNKLERIDKTVDALKKTFWKLGRLSCIGSFGQGAFWF